MEYLKEKSKVYYFNVWTQNNKIIETPVVTRDEIIGMSIPKKIELIKKLKQENASLRTTKSDNYEFNKRVNENIDNIKFAEDDIEIEKEIAQEEQRIKKQTVKKVNKKKQLKKKKEAFICPYGCGRTYTNYNYAGSRKHLTICDLKDEIKMVAYI